MKKTIIDLVWLRSKKMGTTENRNEGNVCSYRDIIQMVDSIIFRYSNALQDLRGLREKTRE